MFAHNSVLYATGYIHVFCSQTGHDKNNTAVRARVRTSAERCVVWAPPKHCCLTPVRCKCVIIPYHKYKLVRVLTPSIGVCSYPHIQDGVSHTGNNDPCHARNQACQAFHEFKPLRMHHESWEGLTSTSAARLVPLVALLGTVDRISAPAHARPNASQRSTTVWECLTFALYVTRRGVP